MAVAEEEDAFAMMMSEMDKADAEGGNICPGGSSASWADASMQTLQTQQQPPSLEVATEQPQAQPTTQLLGTPQQHQQQQEESSGSCRLSLVEQLEAAVESETTVVATTEEGGSGSSLAAGLLENPVQPQYQQPSTIVRVLVSNIPLEATPHDLYEFILAEAPAPCNIHDMSINNGFGYVDFEDAQSSQNALLVHGKLFRSKAISMTVAPGGNRGPRRGGSHSGTSTRGGYRGGRSYQAHHHQPQPQFQPQQQQHQEGRQLSIKRVIKTQEEIAAIEMQQQQPQPQPQQPPQQQPPHTLQVHYFHQQDKQAQQPQQPQQEKQEKQQQPVQQKQKKQPQQQKGNAAAGKKKTKQPQPQQPQNKGKKANVKKNIFELLGDARE